MPLSASISTYVEHTVDGIAGRGGLPGAITSFLGRLTQRKQYMAARLELSFSII
mgnify:CR=1 FL=1|jgi:hypothetical protein